MPRIVGDLIGRGIRYPFTPNSHGGVLINEWIERINQSLFIILSTPKGTRLMQPTFGSDINMYKFEPFDDILLDKIEQTIFDDVRTWEPRINLDSIEFKADPEDKDNHILYIKLSYHLINTDVIGNYVYPFRVGTHETIHESIY